MLPNSEPEVEEERVKAWFEEERLSDLDSGSELTLQTLLNLSRQSVSADGPHFETEIRAKASVK